PPLELLELPPVPWLPGGGMPGATSVEAVTWQPSAAVETVNISGWPAMPAPAAMVSTQRPPCAAAVTVDSPLASSGASKTTWRDADPPGSPYVIFAPEAPIIALEATTYVCLDPRNTEAPRTPAFCLGAGSTVSSFIEPTTGAASPLPSASITWTATAHGPGTA